MSKPHIISSPKSKDQVEHSLVSKSTALILLLVVTVIGAVLRLKHLHDPIGWDEAKITSWLQGFTMLDLLGFYENIGNHIFFSFLAKLSIDIFGLHLWSLRLPALLSGIALIPATYLFFSKVTDSNRFLALVSSTLVACSSLMILTSVNARGYILQTFLIMLWLSSALLLARRSSSLNIAFYILCAWLACYTLPTSVLFVPGIGLWMLLLPLFEKKEQYKFSTSLKRTLAGNIPAGILIILSYAWPVYHTGIETVTARSYFKQETHTLMFLKTLSLPALLSESFHWDLPKVFSLVLPIFAICGLVVMLISNRKLFTLYLLLVLSTIAISLLVRLPLLDRTVTFFFPLYAGAIACAISFLFRISIHKASPEKQNILSALLISSLTILLSIYVISGKMINRAPGYARPHGVREMVEHFEKHLDEKDYWANLYPQFSYWILQLSTDRSRWKAFRPQLFVNPDNQKLLIIVRNHRDKLENVIAFLKYRSLKGVDVENLFDAPRIRWEQRDITVYELKRNDKKDAGLQ